MVATLTKSQILEIHDKLVRSSGEEIDVLSNYKLNSIVLRHKGAKTLAKKAAIFLHDIPNFQPFSEGNKRTAFASTMIFLKYNKKKLKLPKKVLEEIIIYSVNNNLTLREIERILKKAIV